MTYNQQQQQQQQQRDVEMDPPPLTVPNGPRPTYYSCRHTYEETLMKEIQRAAALQKKYGKQGTFETSSPAPGIVRVDDAHSILPELYDPVYALQVIPNAVVVSAESIKNLAKAIYQALLEEESSPSSSSSSSPEEDSHHYGAAAAAAAAASLVDELRKAPKGSLATHGLVPGMAKGQRNPIMLQRSQTIAQELHQMLCKGFPAARKIPNDTYFPFQRWVLQILLMTPNVAIASLAPCHHVGPGQESCCYWPNWYHPLGMAQVDIKETMPSSAYRKLMEALECLCIRPQQTCVDLGACPGGWTSVLRRLDCHVIAVDRSKLDPILMKDPMVEFVQGDAFAYSPSSPVEWMVSDVIAYPERVIELIDRWCGGRWASHMVVTMKFQGETSFDELDHAIQMAASHGYSCRAKHFFNNKNEVTLMIHDTNPEQKVVLHPLESGLLGSPMYTVILPTKSTD